MPAIFFVSMAHHTQCDTLVTNVMAHDGLTLGNYVHALCWLLCILNSMNTLLLSENLLMRF